MRSASKRENHYNTSMLFIHLMLLPGFQDLSLSIALHTSRFGSYVYS